MKKLIFTILSPLFFWGLFSQEIPERISYQGKLLENGVAVNGTKSIIFTIGTWSETKNVQVTKGLYSVTLGELTPIPISIFDNNSSISLQISVEGTNLSPQTEILSVPYAYKAEKAVDTEKIMGNPILGTPNTNEVLKWNGSSWTPQIDATNPSGTASGDLSGTYPNPTVDGLQNRPVSSSSPSVNQVLKWNGSQWAPDTDDSGGSPTGTAAGDLSGTYPNPTVDGLQNRPVSSSSPSTNQILKWNGSQWVPADETGGGESLSQTLAIGNSAGSYNIDMNDNNINNIGEINMTEDADISIEGTNGALRLHNSSFIILYNNNGDDSKLLIEGNDDGLDRTDFNMDGDIWFNNWNGSINYAKISGGNFWANGDIACGGNKYFIQVHPNDSTKEIVYVCLEGGEAGTYTRGTSKLINGEVTINFPEHFGLVTSHNGLTAQITPRGDCNGIYTVLIDANKLMVKELMGGTSDVEFDYFIQGVRKGYENHLVIRDKVSK